MAVSRAFAASTCSAAFPARAAAASNAARTPARRPARSWLKLSRSSLSAPLTWTYMEDLLGTLTRQLGLRDKVSSCAQGLRKCLSNRQFMQSCIGQHKYGVSRTRLAA